MSLLLGIIASSRGNIVPPLDTFGGAAAAYSTRLLSSAYGGSAVRVRRSFDNTEQDIGFSGGAINETALMNFVGYQNLVQRSEEFDDTYWFKSFSTVTPNTILSPINTLTADSVFEDTANNVHGIQKSVSVTLGQSYNFSCYVRSINGREGTIIRFGDGASDGVIGAYIGSITFSFISESFVNTAGVNNAQFQKIGDWYRLSCSVISTAATLSISIWGWDGSAGAYGGNPSKGLYLWGAQLSTRTALQPYQITTSAARLGDGFVTKWYTQDSNGENLVLQSQTFNVLSSWATNNLPVTANSTTAPDGTLTADSIIPDTVLGAHYIIQTISKPTTNNTYNISCYIKANGYSYGALAVTGAALPNQAQCLFDLVNGTVSAPQNVGTGFTAVSSSITNVGSGWFRISLVFISDTSNQIQPYVRVDQSAGVTTYAGNGTSGLFVWGYQCSQSSWLQGYQATTTSQVFRRDASQSTAANQPRIVGGGVIERENGKVSIFFDGVNDFLTGTDIALPVWSIFSTAVQNVTNVSGYHTIYNRGSITSSSRDALLLLSNFTKTLDVQRANGSSFPFASAYTSLQNYFLASGIFSGSQLTAFADSITGASTSTSITGSVNPITLIGATRESAGAPAYYMGGEMGEIIVYDSNRISTRADIERNIGAYYQTQWTGASSGLLDQFGGAAAAYSLRNLSSSYRGPLIRVRRSSDNAETDIGGTFSGDLDVASLVSFTGGQNLALQSEDFSSGSWLKTNSAVTANATIAPDGALTADKLTETAFNGQHAVGQNYTIAASSSFTLSFYAKAAERSNIGLSFYLNSGTFDNFGFNLNLITGVVNTSGAGGAGLVISTSVQNVGNGWWRCSITGTTNKIGAHVGQMSLLDNSFNASYLGVAGSGVYVWGAQLNTGILQPYIPTTTSAINGANGFVTKWYTQDNNYQNLLLQSQTFENASWGKLGITVSANSTTDPLGGSTGYTIFETALNNQHFINQTNAYSAGTYTFSVYLKYLNRKYVLLDLSDNVANGAGVVFDVELGAYVGNSSVGTGYTVQSYLISPQANGWYRYSITLSTSGIPQSDIQLRNSNTLSWINTYAGSTSVGVYIWGAQLNDGSVAQPYTATTTTVSQRRDAIQATATAQPRIVNSGGVESEGNKPALFFDGVDDRFVPSAFGDVFQNVGYANLFFAARNISTDANLRLVFSTSIGTNASTRFSTAKQSDGTIVTGGRRLDSDSFAGLGGGSFTESNIIGSALIQYQTSDAYLYSNNNLIASSTSFLTDGNTSNTASAAVSIGSDYSANVNSFWNGDMQELVFYNTNRFPNASTIQSNINSYYQIYWQGNGTALLDNFSGASAAYSLRNLSSAYTGPLIRVRRSSDNVERDIYGTFGGDLDIASLVAFVGANSGFVTTWYDQSGSARNAVQGTAARQPRIVNAGVVDTENGKPALSFATTQDLSLANILNFNGVNSSFFMTIKRSTSGNDAIMIDVGSNTYLWLNYSGTQYYGGTTVIDADLSTANQYMIAAATMNYGVSLKWYKNGNLEQNKTTGFSLGQAFSTILHITYRASIVQTSELIVYPSNVDSSAVQIQSNINNYYKIY